MEPPLVREVLEQGTPDRQAMIVHSSGPDACCRCGEKTGSGIYVRAKPDTMTCKGLGSVHAEDSA